MKFNKTAFGVGIFVVILIFAGYSAKSNADSIHLGLGKTFVNSSLAIGEIGYEKNNFEVQASLMEDGSTKNGQQDKMQIYSVSYLTKPQWGYKGIEPYVRLGLSYNDGSELVGRTNFRLGLGLDFNEVLRVEYVHHSSAGIHNPNTGIDYIMLNYTVQAPW
jgi:hypothetical protein